MRIPKGISWKIVAVAAALPGAGGLFWIVRNTLDLLGIGQAHIVGNNPVHYTIGYLAASLYVLAFGLLLKRHPVFLIVYIAAAVSRWSFWLMQPSPLYIGFVILCADALVIATGLGWLSRKQRTPHA